MKPDDQDTDTIRKQLRQDQEASDRLSRRKWKEWRFKLYTFSALLFAAGFVTFFLYDLVRKGYSALWQAEVKTKITYSPETMKDPKTAFPEEVRDLVSPAVIRKIRRTGQSPSIQMTVHYDRASVENPEKAIQSITLEKDEFPVYLDKGPFDVPRDHLLQMIGPVAMNSIRTTLQKGDPPGKKEVSLIGSGALQQHMLSMDQSPFPDEVQTSVENMIKTDRVTMKFNHERFGEQETVEKWIVLDSDADQFVKNHYSDVGYRADVYRRLMKKLGRSPVPDPDLEKLLAEIKKFEELTIAKQEKQSDGSNSERGEEGDGTAANPDRKSRSASEQQEIRVSSTSRLKELINGWKNTRTIERLKEEGTIALSFNDYFFLNTDSSENPEVAGMKSAVVGSVFVLLVVLVTAVPIGVMTSVYLEEFAPDNWLTQIIEININNLAAIPSILYGLLGLAFFVNTVGFPRSAVIVGGLTLSLMTLPIVIISSRSALRAVPDSIRMAGFSMGATRWEVVLHHVLPQSITGILTGTIIGLAQAMGETAPLIIIGMVGFFPNTPESIFDSSTVMPAQIFQWWSLPHRAFESRAALAILLLLFVLFLLNGTAVFIRAKTQETGS